MAEKPTKPAAQDVDFSSLMSTCRLSANAYTGNRRDPASALRKTLRLYACCQTGG